MTLCEWCVCVVGDGCVGDAIGGVVFDLSMGVCVCVYVWQCVFFVDVGVCVCVCVSGRGL